MLPTQSPVIDVRQIPPPQRHTTIFGQFDELLPGEAVQIVSDHDPRPLHHQFDARSPGQFQWAYLQSGPDQWRVLISKLEIPEDAEEHHCCSGGACGG
ncbi:MAG: DUF2249 domain-containing protein [Simplicispira suum]|uniref:DUF2249 domain-containing protein n=1 Tax=Simplicispira suum TaxID=2109915 RepID=UPI001C6C905D|nr:DUF2249 domain-containing protein [Simplicispira suum]MBW7834712.1 DUF2249 domain-containing protein [Simplicispira suum]